MSKVLKRIAGLILLSLFGQNALATVDFFVKETVIVQAKPQSDSPVIAELKDGDRAIVAPNFYKNGWRKIKVKIDGKAVIGYVDSRKLVLSFFKDRNDLKKEIPYRERIGLGGSLVLGYLVQDGESYTAGSETYKVNKFAAPAFALAGYMDLPFDEHKVRGYAILRYNLFSGQATSNLGNNASVSETRMGIGLGANAKIYWDKKSKFWFGLGGELTKILSSDLSSTATAEIEAEDEPPLYILGTLNFGWDHKMFANFYLQPEFRGMINLKPFFYGGEFVLSMGLGF